MGTLPVGRRIRVHRAVGFIGSADGAIEKRTRGCTMLSRISVVCKSCVVAFAALVCGTVALPGRASAQEPEAERRGAFEVTGYVGVLTPLAKLADQGDSISAEFSTKAAFSIELDYWLPSGFGIGIIGGYARPDLTLQIVDPDQAFPIPVELGATDYLLAVGTLMYRPNLRGAATVLVPYVGLGAGVVSLSYPVIAGEIQIQDETRFAGTILAGGQIRVSDPVYVRLDLRDYVSQFNTEPFEKSKMQHDVTISVGVGVRLR